MTGRVGVPRETVAELRAVCLALPEAHEEAAWVGTRWRIRKQTFAHVLMIDAGWPAAYARAADCDGPVCVLTFRSPLPELDAFAFTWPPFFRPGWWPDIVGVILDGRVDRDEITGLLTESYRRLAPKKLAASVADPPPDGRPRGTQRGRR